MSYNEGIKSFTANGAVSAHRLVKISSGTTTDPPQVEHAGAGEDAIGVSCHAAADGAQVSIKLLNYPGTYEIECTVSSAISRGTLLYAAASGKVSDASSGSSVGQSCEVGASTQVIEVAMDYRKPTTAAGTSIADAGNFTSTTTVEAATQEIYQDIFSIQQFINVPLTSLRETSTFNVGNIAANGGLLASDTTPVLSAINGATDGCQVVKWAASNSDQVMFQTALPPNLDDTADVVVHIRAYMAGTTDTPDITVDSFFNEGDTKVVDTISAITGTSAAEYTGTIGNADVPSGAQTLTVGLTPGAHTTDILYVTAIWLEYKAKIRTS